MKKKITKAITHTTPINTSSYNSIRFKSKKQILVQVIFVEQLQVTGIHPEKNLSK